MSQQRHSPNWADSCSSAAQSPLPLLPPLLTLLPSPIYLPHRPATPFHRSPHPSTLPCSTCVKAPHQRYYACMGDTRLLAAVAAADFDSDSAAANCCRRNSDSARIAYRSPTAESKMARRARAQKVGIAHRRMIDGALYWAILGPLLILDLLLPQYLARVHSHSHCLPHLQLQISNPQRRAAGHTKAPNSSASALAPLGLHLRPHPFGCAPGWQL